MFLLSKTSLFRYQCHSKYTQKSNTCMVILFKSNNLYLPFTIFYIFITFPFWNFFGKNTYYDGFRILVLVVTFIFFRRFVSFLLLLSWMRYICFFVTTHEKHVFRNLCGICIVNILDFLNFLEDF